MRAALDLPAGFSFRRTVLSHGWSDLAPFEVGEKVASLATTVSVPGRGAHRIVLHDEAPAVVLEIAGRPDAALREALHRAARRVLNVDLDLAAFHAACRADERTSWIATTGSGRLLRAPTPFEDVVKLVLTTNCSWAFTRRMVATLVDRFGEVSATGAKSFPSPEPLARLGESGFRTAVRAGYRSPYLASLARGVASGEVDLSALERTDRTPAELRREMLRLPGVGPYVAENLLKMLGRPDGLALDSWMRANYARLYHGGREVRDRTIDRSFGRFGPWAGLALWFVLTGDWFSGDEPSQAWSSLA